jgi:hypothetical protein
MKKIFILATAVLLVGVFAYTANASHSWGSYHWGHTTNSLNLKLGDNLSSTWDAYLITASSDWTVSSILDTTIVTGASKGNCQPTKGRVEVCNKTYGNNGWLGVAQIWASGTHITQGSVKMNDTYFNTATYNTPAWKQMVVCQEIGHTFGLNHQDENFDNPNLGTCMDYTSDPSTNTHPNNHDYDQLATIYAHLDSTNTSTSTISKGNAQVDLDNPTSWGKAVSSSAGKKSSLYERDFGKGEKVFTFVIWAE